MAVQIAVVRRLRASARKSSHTAAIQIINHLPLLTADLEGMEHLSLLLSIKEERDPFKHLTLRTVLKRIQM
jgi:hypothetical protein